MCALFKGSAVVGAISGKTGGTVFSRNKSGAYLKGFVVPTNPNTIKQQDVRSSFANLVGLWKGLTKAQQQAWIDITPQYPYQNRVGDTKEYTGQQLFIKLNMNLDVVGAAVLNTPLVPEAFSDTKVTATTFTLTAGVLTTATVTLQAIGLATESIIVMTTINVGGGINNPAQSMFKLTQVFTDASAGVSLDILTTYLALYGSPGLSTTVFARAWMINENTGQRLNLGQASAVVGGT